MTVLWVALVIVALFMVAAVIGMVIALRAPDHILCLECSPIGAGARWRRPEPGEVCEACGVEPVHVEY